jgi:predicted dehydrogenase
MKRLLFVLLAALALNVPVQASPADSAPLRVVILGMVHGHVEGFLSSSLHRPDVEIVGISEPDQAVAARYAAQFKIDKSLLFADAEQMLRQTHPQAALVYTNTFDHRQAVELCARYGVHVMMEKPLAVSVEDARAIEKAAQQGKIQVVVNYETTWYRSNRAVYDIVHESSSAKSIGPVRKIVVHDGHEGPREINVAPEFLAWLTDPKLDGGGALFDFGCYGADLATWLMDGARPTSVTAITQHIKPDIYPHVDDEATIILTYPNAQAIIQASWNWPFGRKDMEVYGKTGYAITVERDNLRVRRPGEQEQQIAADLVPSPEEDSLTYLRAIVLGGVQPSGLSSLQTNLVVTEILDAARQSATSGKAVHLAPTD